MLHLTNGDSAAHGLRESALPGEVIVWADVLHEGPTPAEHGPLWRQTRAEYLSRAGYGSYDRILRAWARADAALDEFRGHDELVLWFEHDLFDQLLLARHLHWLGTCGHVNTRVSLVCIDRFPGVEPFHGLGQLRGEQLATLYPSRQAVSAAQLRAGADVWRAFTAPEPGALNAIVRHGCAELPFMAAALRRHLEEFPGISDGLSRTQRSVLQLVRDAPKTVRELFLAQQALEEHVFMGDASFWRIVREMASGLDPLVHVTTAQEKDSTLPETDVAIAPVGTRVLEGGEDAVRLRGIHGWLGGVRLDPVRLWRWNGSAVVLTSGTSRN